MNSLEKLRLLCLGDVAICEDLSKQGSWQPPAGLKPDENTQILFNFEIPLGAQLNPLPRSSGPRFLAHPCAVETVKRWAPGFVALANNHILDGEAEGLITTCEQLTRAGFKVVGAGFVGDQHREVQIWENRCGSLAILNWVFPETHPEWDQNPGPNCWKGLDYSCSLLSRYKKEVNWIVVVLHWSDELFAFPHPQDRLIAKGLAEQGADIIIGHHPHVIRGWEQFGNCAVFYSLGNFYFSDIRDESGNWLVKEAPRNRESLGVEIHFSKGGKPQIFLHSFWRVDGQTKSDTFHRAERRLNAVSKPLQKLDIEVYPIWYQKKRQWFNRIGYRWHFRLHQLGTRQFFMTVAQKIRHTFIFPLKPQTRKP